MPKHKNPCPGGYEIYNLRRPFLGHQKYILHLSEPCPGVEEKIFKEIMHFHNMTYMATPEHKNPCIDFTYFLPQNYLPLEWGSWNLQRLAILPYRCYIPNLVQCKDWPSSSWEEDVNGRCRTDGGRWTTTDPSPWCAQYVIWVTQMT